MYGRVTRWRHTGHVDGTLPDEMELYSSKYPRANKRYNEYDKIILGELKKKMTEERLKKATYKWLDWDAIEEVIRASIAMGRTPKGIADKLKREWRK